MNIQIDELVFVYEGFEPRTREQQYRIKHVKDEEMTKQDGPKIDSILNELGKWETCLSGLQPFLVELGLTILQPQPPPPFIPRKWWNSTPFNGYWYVGIKHADPAVQIERSQTDSLLQNVRRWIAFRRALEVLVSALPKSAQRFG